VALARWNHKIRAGPTFAPAFRLGDIPQRRCGPGISEFGLPALPSAIRPGPTGRVQRVNRPGRGKVAL